jgi:hypothetical protein
MAANPEEAQMNPGVAKLQAFFTAARVRFHRLDLADVSTRHDFSFSRERNQGSEIGSRRSIDFREFLTFATIRGSASRKEQPGGWNRSSSDTVLA